MQVTCYRTSIQSLSDQNNVTTHHRNDTMSQKNCWLKKMLTWETSDLFPIHTSTLILAGTLANSGDDAYVVSSSTASISGFADSAHFRRLSSVKSQSRSCKRTQWHHLINIRRVTFGLPREGKNTRFFLPILFVYVKSRGWRWQKIEDSHTGLAMYSWPYFCPINSSTCQCLQWLAQQPFPAGTRYINK